MLREILMAPPVGERSGSYLCNLLKLLQHQHVDLLVPIFRRQVRIRKCWEYTGGFSAGDDVVRFAGAAHSGDVRIDCFSALSGIRLSGEICKIDISGGRAGLPKFIIHVDGARAIDT